MPAKPVMVRMTDEQLVQLDTARGEQNRSEFIRTLVATHAQRHVDDHPVGCRCWQCPKVTE